MKPYGRIESIAEYVTRGLRKAIAIILVGSAATVVLATEESSYNLAKHLKNPSPIALDSSYHAAIEFLDQYKQPIIDNSGERNVPLELIATTFIRENHRRTVFEDLKDWFATGKIAYFLDTYVLPITQKIPFPYKPRFLVEPTNPSLGPGQVQVCTAADLDKKFGIEPVGRTALEELLQQPDVNIMYVALEWADLMSQSNRLPPVPNTNIFDYPELIGILRTEYGKGPTGTELRDARPSQDGREFLHLLASTNFKDIFGDHSTITAKQQQKMIEYAKQNKGKSRIGNKLPKKQKVMSRTKC